MALNPKVAAGGIAALGGAAGTGVAIHKATSSEEVKVVEQPKTKIKVEIEKLGFEVLDLTATAPTSGNTSENWNKLVEVSKKIITDTAKNTDELRTNELKKTCNKLLGSDYDSAKNEWKDAIKKCTKLITLKDRATFLELSPLNTTESSADTKWTAKWDGTTEGEIKTIIEGTTNGVTPSGSDSKAKHKNYCKAIEAKNHIEADVDADKLWDNYLTACIEGNQKKNYWTKEVKNG